MKKKPLLGAHVSVAGGIHNAPGNGLKSGCDVVQIFARYPTRWETPPIGPEVAEKFIAEERRTGVRAVATHASYLINLAASSSEFQSRSVIAMADEMRRAALLGIRHVVVHPGSARDTDETGAIVRIARAIRELAGDCDEADICLETTAGQGSSVGHRLSHFWEIMDRSGFPERVSLCLDSCHLFAAGYDISSGKGYEAFAAELESLELTEKVKVIHVNDSKRELGSRVDRHEHIGEGKIGLRGFAHLLTYPPFRDVPFILETPKGDNPEGSDKENLQKLRGLLERRGK